MNHLAGRRTPRLLTHTLVGVVMTALIAFGTGAQAQPATTAGDDGHARAGMTKVLESEFGKAKSRVVGSFGQSGTLDAVFVPKRVKAVGDQLMVVGKLRGDLVRGNGKVVGAVNDRVRLPIVEAEGSPVGTGLVASGARTAATCDILNLVLGPLDLDLLGLQVHLDRVVLNIVAVTGAGNLLGNLLCAVAGLLDNVGLGTQIAQILNAILALLRQ